MRVRFAPSPTGYLHVGGARAALFNWLLARKLGGTFILRIEDTDRQRSSEQHTQAILGGLTWLGLDWDDGPIFQSDGIERHRADARRLLEAGKAYRDFTTAEQLKAEAERRGLTEVRRLPRLLAAEMGEAEAERRAAAGDPFAVRFLVPEGETAWNDTMHGELRFANADIEDMVVLRSDSTATYNMAVVSDDADESVTLVLRGDDHISNTPKQILLYEALGHPVPGFGHLPLILGPDGKRLSKRHGATAVQEYESMGILPEALFNFLALLGWNPGDERELMSREEIVGEFTLERVQKKSAVFDTTKLEWLNGQHLARRPPGDLVPRVVARLGDGDLAALPEGFLPALVDLLKVRARTVEEIATMARPYLSDDAFDYEPESVAKHWAKEPALIVARLERLQERLSAVPWEQDSLEQATRSLGEEMGVSAGKMIHPLRVAITGRQHSPGMFDVLVLLGKERSLARLDRALHRLREIASSIA
ncbi:MAG: glutamate--tRNA ligase [Gemmatimonadetes bacterium]|nr:glutamate--tRNA ligase [Gemmatimonadota bacterium]